MYKIETLIRCIKNIRGFKLLSLENHQAEHVNVNMQDDKIVANSDHFFLNLMQVFERKGCLLVIQFLPLKMERTLNNGRTIWINQKKVFGFNISYLKWKPIPIEELKLRFSSPDYFVSEVSCADINT